MRYRWSTRRSRRNRRVSLRTRSGCRICARPCSRVGLAGRQAAEDFQSLKREMELFGPSASRGGESIIDVDNALKNLRPSNHDAIERLKGLADEVAALPTPAEKSARVIEIFGRRLGPQLVELLSEGRKAIDAHWQARREPRPDHDQYRVQDRQGHDRRAGAASPRHRRHQELDRPIVCTGHHRGGGTIHRGDWTQPNRA